MPEILMCGHTCGNLPIPNLADLAGSSLSNPYLAASKAALLKFSASLRIFIYACADGFYP